MGAITQVLLQEGAPARPPGKYLQAGTDFGHYLPDLDSCPLPRVAAQLPKRSPLYTRGVRALPLDPPRSSSRSAVFSCGGDEIGHLFVENIDLFCSCVTGKQNCV